MSDLVENKDLKRKAENAARRERMEGAVRDACVGLTDVGPDGQVLKARPGVAHPAEGDLG